MEILMKMLAVCLLIVFSASAAFAQASYEEVVLSDNPVAYWRLNEKSVDAGIVDATGNVGPGAFDDLGGIETGFDGAIVNDDNTAVQFALEGGFGCGAGCGRGEMPVGGVLDLGTVDSDQNITLEAWFKLMPDVDAVLPGSAFPRIFHYNNFEDGQYAFGIVGDDNAGFEAQRTVWAGRGDGSDAGFVILAGETDAIEPSDEEVWYHFAAHLENDDVRLFLNGQQLSGLTDADPIFWQAEQATIGARLQSDEISVVQSFPGLIDELAVYAELLPAERILAHYEAGIGILPPVITIDSLQDEIKAGTNNPEFDLNDDGLVNLVDQGIFIHDYKNTWIGDANFDGLFDSTDFVQVFAAAKYEDNNPDDPSTIMNAVWAEGDWNADREFDSQDFVIAFQDAGYEQGPRVPAAVPEPNSCVLFLTGLLCLLRRRK